MTVTAGSAVATTAAAGFIKTSRAVARTNIVDTIGAAAVAGHAAIFKEIIVEMLGQ